MVLFVSMAEVPLPLAEVPRVFIRFPKELNVCCALWAMDLIFEACLLGVVIQ